MYIYIAMTDFYVLDWRTGSSKTQNYLYQAKERLHRYKRESFRLNPPLPFPSYRCKTPGKNRVNFFKEKFWVLVTLSLVTPIGAKPILVQISINVIHCTHVPYMMVSEKPIHSVWQLKPMNVRPEYLTIRFQTKWLVKKIYSPCYIFFWKFY